MDKIRIAVVGFGDRSEQYTKYVLSHPNEAEIVAVVEPRKVRRDFAKNLFGIKDENCFDTYDSFIEKGKIADCVINGTMDNLHVVTTLPLLQIGYDVLLEKPITSKKEELLQLLDAANKYKRKIVICHVLRYTPFYKKIKELILDDVIGKVRHIETAENVGVAHASISYVRGKWNNSDKCGSSYLLAKCCHDLDLLCWLNDSTKPINVSSFGSKNWFIAKNAPKNSGNRCLVDCPIEIEKECPYSTRKMHIDNNPMPITVWSDIDKLPQDVTLQDRIQALKTTNPHGTCIFKTDANIVDEQMTMLKFDNGSTAYHNLFSGAARAGRRIMIYGTKGEIEGFVEDSRFIVRLYNANNILYDEKLIVINDDIKNDNHYGGDARIVEDFLHVLRGEKPSISTSSLLDSVVSHLCVYASDESMRDNEVKHMQN